MSERLHTITAPQLGSEVFLWRFAGEEELGRCFKFELEVLCQKPDLTADKALGTSVSLTMLRPDGSPRYFNGLVSRLVYIGHRGGYHLYQITLRPWLWFLSLTSDCRIFQQMTTEQIVTKVFKEKNQFSDFKAALSGTYRTWEYCCQYRETDLDFVSRLLEQEGIYFYFEHELGKHTLKLVDGPSAHTPIEGEPKVPYLTGGEAYVGEEHINDWFRAREVRSGAYALRDFDFEKPSANLEVRSQLARSHALATKELYDYPGEYVVRTDGDKYARARIDEIQWQYAPVQGQGNVTAFAVGRKFTLRDYPDKAENVEFTIIRTEIQIDSGETEILSDESQNRFGVRFVAIESKEQFRPRRTTPRPVIAGPQTAIVVGPAGDEIWTDKYGRVKVQFHWDREGKKDENSSCFVRVAQIWAGKNWGGIHIPRIGQEVIVEFLEGDPDRPLITGRVYNAEQMPPYSLPANATQSGIKSRSSKEGTTANFNELRFEDKKDAEEIYFHAEKNFNRVVENNDTLRVGFDKKEQGDQTIEIFNNQTLKVGDAQASDGSQTIEIWKDRTESVKTGNEKVTIEKGNRDVAINLGNDKLTVGTGNLTIKVTSGIVSITAGQKIELKVGASSMVMDMASITLKSPMITVDGQLTTDVKGLLTTVDGTAVNTIKGGIVLIN